MVTDTPNFLTLAYTYRKPTLLAKDYSGPIFPRTHHQDFDLQSVTFVPQNETGDVLVHTFDIIPAPGCHDIYYVAFDGPDPFARRSISPIFALTYCSTGGGVPEYQRGRSNIVPPTLATPYWILTSIIVTDATDFEPLQSDNATVFTLSDPVQALVAHYNTHVNPCPPQDQFNGAMQTYLVLCEEPLPVFNQPWLGNCINGVGNQPTQDFSLVQDYKQYDCLSAGWTVESLGDLKTGPNQVSLFDWRGFGYGGWEETLPPFLNDAWSIAYGPAVEPTMLVKSVNGDCCWTATQVRFNIAGEITDLADITTGWKKRPALPEP